MSRDHRRINGRSGFTIMELLIVMAIMTLIMGISMVAYFETRPRVVLRGVAQQVASEIQKARLLSIQQSRNVRMLFETQAGGQTSDYNPTGVTFEWLVIRVVEGSGVEREVSNYQLPKGYPPVYLWGHAEAIVGGASANTFIDGDLELTPSGALADTEDAGKAFRFSSPQTDRQRNILEVSIKTASAGSPTIGKYLLASDRPPTAAGQDYFAETIAQLSTTKNLWVWY